MSLTTIECFTVIKEADISQIEKQWRIKIQNMGWEVSQHFYFGRQLSSFTCATVSECRLLICNFRFFLLSLKWQKQQVVFLTLAFKMFTEAERTVTAGGTEEAVTVDSFGTLHFVSAKQSCLSLQNFFCRSSSGNVHFWHIQCCICT